MALVGLALVLRAGTWIAYRPMLVGITDVWGYISLGLDLDLAKHFVLAPDRPFGYPLLLWILDRPAGLEPGLVTALQHLLGLAGGVLAYWFLIRVGTRRWLALAATALILLDTYAIALEQTLMPEAWFTFGLIAAAVLAASGTPSAWRLLAAGLILGATAGVRFAALTAIPIWCAYLLWRYRAQPRRLAAGLAGLALPLVAYLAIHSAATGEVGFADASGTFLYGRVAYLSDCSKMDVPPEQRFLCQPEQERVDDPGFYIWNEQGSPARARYPGWAETAAEQSRIDGLLGEFARATIRSRPLAYLELVARDFSRYFTPGSDPYYSEGAIELPASLPPDAGPLAASVLPEYVNEARYPAPALATLQEALHTQRWLLGPLALLAILSLALALARAAAGRVSRQPRRRETFLFAGMALITLVSAAATAQFGLRYLVSVAPLLLIAGALAIEDLAALRRRTEPPRPPELLADAPGDERALEASAIA